jgi:hypothetical protein
MARRKTVEQNLEVRVSIGRATGGDEHAWRIHVEDLASHFTIMELRMTDAELGQALGHSPVEVGARYWGQNPDIGKRHENATVLVPLDHEDWPSWADRDDEAVAEAMASSRQVAALKAMARTPYPSEEGWRPEVDTTFNRHRLTPEGYQVTVRRYV